jgi:hypothetical protein
MPPYGLRMWVPAASPAFACGRAQSGAQAVRLNDPEIGTDRLAIGVDGPQAVRETPLGDVELKG